MDIIYAAYGSNMSERQMSLRCPESKLIAVGFLPGFKLVFDSFSTKWNGAVADVEPTGNHADMVPVVLYRLTPKDLSLLDEFEGYPGKYNRKVVNVLQRNGQHASALIYFLMNQHKGDYSNPSDAYFKQIRNAYVRFKFKGAYVDAARQAAINFEINMNKMREQAKPAQESLLPKLENHALKDSDFDDILDFLKDWN